MGSGVQSTVGCLPELCFNCFCQFSVAQVLVGFRKQFINNSVFPARVCDAGFNNNNNNNSPHSSVRCVLRHGPHSSLCEVCVHNKIGDENAA